MPLKRSDHYRSPDGDGRYTELCGKATFTDRNRLLFK